MAPHDIISELHQHHPPAAAPSFNDADIQRLVDEFIGEATALADELIRLKNKWEPIADAVDDKLTPSQRARIEAAAQRLDKAFGL